MLTNLRDRRGPAWFFTGQAGCYCCDPPPPPPPPPPGRAYYYAIGRCTCNNCGVFGLLQDGTRDDYAACAWQVEIDGFTSMVDPGCGAGSICEPNNGTFILVRTTAGPSPVPGSGSIFIGQACRWASAPFTSTAIQPVLVPPNNCPQCSGGQGMRYELWIQKSLLGLYVMLKLVDIVNDTISAQWEKIIGPLECDQAHNLDLATAYTHNATQACCQNAPGVVTILPL